MRETDIAPVDKGCGPLTGVRPTRSDDVLARVIREVRRSNACSR